MKKKGAIFRVAILTLLLLIFSSLVAISASAQVSDTATDAVASPTSYEAAPAEWGSEAVTDFFVPGDVKLDMDTLLIILITMTLFAFGALFFKLFGNRISTKELTILLLVLIFVFIVIAVAMYIGLTGSGEGQGAASALANVIFWEVI